MPLLAVVDKVTEQDKMLFKDVKKVKASSLLKGYHFPSGTDYFVVDEFDNVLNQCSEEYSLVPNKSIFLPIEEKLNAGGVDYVRQVSTVSDSQFHVSYLLKSKKAKVLGDLYPKLTIVNSYDGKVKFRHEFGWFRLVCLNGMTRPHGDTVVQVSKHSADLTEINLMFLIRDIMDETNAFLEESKKDIERYERLNSKKVTAQLISEVTKQLSLSDKIATAATERFNFETGKSDEPFTYVDLDGNVRSSRNADESLFTLYNSINYAIFNLNPKEPMDSKQKKDALLLTAVEARLN